jgi:hypothetical protein
MDWNRESFQPTTPSAPQRQHGRLLRLILVLTTVKDVVTVLVVCVLGSHRLFVLLPRWAAFCVMAVAVLRLLALVGVWRFSRLAVVLYLLLGFAGVVIYAIVDHPVGNPLVSMGCAALIALGSISRWLQFSWWGSSRPLKR